MAMCIHCECYEVSQPGQRCDHCQFFIDGGGYSNPDALTLDHLRIEPTQDDPE